MRKAILLAATLGANMVGGPTGLAEAAEGPTADLKRRATFISTETATLRLRYSCPVGYETLEALTYITQDGFTSMFGGFSSVTCDGKQHWAQSTVSSFEEAPFHLGSASATIYLLVQKVGTFDTLSAGDTGAIRLT
jgi:hypothetical protein